MTNKLIGSHETGIASATLTDTEYTGVSVVAGGTLNPSISNQGQPSLYCLQAATSGTNGVAYAELDWGSDETIVYGMVKVKFTAVPSAITGVIAVTDSAGTQLFSIRVNASGFWQVNNNANATVYTSTVYKPVAGVWHRVEFYWKQDAAAGEFTIKIDKVADADLTKTGLNNGAAKPRRLRLGVVEAETNAPSRYIDDYIVNSDQGSLNNTWVGNGYVRQLPMDGNDLANWTVVDAGKANWQCMAEKPWNSNATDMIKSSTSAQEERMTVAALGSDSTSLTIIALMALIRQRRAVAGSAANVTVYLRSNGTDDAGAACDSGSTTWKTFRCALDETDPSGGAAWTLARVNAVLLKFIHEANTNECDVNAALVYVAFTMSDAVSESPQSGGAIGHTNQSARRIGPVVIERQPRRGRAKHNATYS